MELHNEMVLEEKRNQTPSDRMKGLMAFLSSHATSASRGRTPTEDCIGCPTVKYRSGSVTGTLNEYCATEVV